MKKAVAIISVFALAATAVILWLDRDPPVPLAEIYNSHTKELSGFLVAVEKQHRFPNGKIEEGWLIQDANVKGAWPVWYVKPKKAEVVWR